MARMVLSGVDGYGFMVLFLSDGIIQYWAGLVKWLFSLIMA